MIYSCMISRTRSAITAGSSSKANSKVRSNSWGPVMSKRNPPLNGSEAIHASCGPRACLPRATTAERDYYLSKSSSSWRWRLLRAMPRGGTVVTDNVDLLSFTSVRPGFRGAPHDGKSAVRFCNHEAENHPGRSRSDISGTSPSCELMPAAVNSRLPTSHSGGSLPDSRQYFRH